jgi:tetratricopeptide (TPR) repeat protein
VLRLTLLLAAVAAALVGLGYLFYLNPDAVTVQLSRTSQWHAPLALVLLVTFLVGATLTFVVSLVRESRHAVLGWRRTRNARRVRRQQLRKEQGLGLSWLGEYDKARAVLAKGLRDHPDDLTAFLLFARTYLSERDSARALGVLHEGADTRGPDPKLLLFLGEAQRGVGDLAAAGGTLERARAADPASPRILAALRDTYVAAGRWSDAAKVQEAVLVGIRDPLTLGDAERRATGLRYQSALSAPTAEARVTDLRALLRAQPDFEPAAVSLGDALLDAGQVRQAERVWRRALARGARAGALERLEHLLRGGPRAHRLDALTRKLVRRRPDDGTARLFHARQLIRDGKLDDAAAELAQIAPPWSSLPGYHALLAELHVRRGAYDDAVTAFRQALAAGAVGAFRCEVCATEADEWHGFCPPCGSWSSYRSSYEITPPVTRPGASAGAGASPDRPRPSRT